MTPLLHLVEPASRRAALDDGALRPPALADVGFVHVPAPEQVHLPAAGLVPGRRDSGGTADRAPVERRRDRRHGRPDLEEVVGQLVGRERRNDAVPAVHDLAAREEGRPVAPASCASTGATAVVESMLTDAAARGR